MGEADADEADALNVVEAQADLQSRHGMAVVGVPVADEDAIDGQQGAAAGGLDQRRVELIHVHGHGRREAHLARHGFEQETVVGGVLLELAIHSGLDTRLGGAVRPDIGLTSGGREDQRTPARLSYPGGALVGNRCWTRTASHSTGRRAAISPPSPPGANRTRGENPSGCGSPAWPAGPGRWRR